ncbi:MAG: cadherin-like domain-containing protein [Saprospiraceae bacterium]|nr:cadherin-like domain-containing protein [Saprospiraceae bacterium]
MNFNFIIAENPAPTYIQTFITSAATCLGGAQADITLNDPMGALMEFNVTHNNTPFISATVASGIINLGEIANLLPGNYQISVVGVGCPPRCAQVIDFSISQEDLEFEVNDDLADIPSGTVWNGNVLTNDEGTGMNVTGFTQPSAGTVSVDEDGSAIFTPPADFSGSVTFTYTVRDTCGIEKSALVTITVGAVPCDFTAQFTNTAADCGKMNGSSAVLIIPQGDAYIVNWPDGTQGLNNAMLFAGSHTVSISDLNAGCTQNFTTNIQELPPVELIQQISTNPGTCIGGGSLNFTLINPKSMDIVAEVYLDNQLMMTVSIAALSTFSGEIESLAAGTYLLQVVESGCPLRCADAETVEVGSTDLPMTLTNDSYFISFGDTWQGNVLTNDTGTGLNVIDNTEPASGTLTLNENGFGTWIPEPGFSGVVSFTYTAQDTCGQIKIATVTIEVSLTACDFTASLISTPAQCGVANGSAQIMLFPADGLYIIAWQDGQTSELINNLNSGLYLVSVTDQINGCTKVFSIQVEEVPIDMIQSISSQAGNCTGEGEIILDISNGFLQIWS